MLVIISPAKTLDFETAPILETFTQPEFMDDAATLVDQLKSLTAGEVGKLMKLSDKLAQLNYERYRAWQPPFDLANAKQAVLAFKGDVYTGLDADSLSIDDLNWAQDHLRMLSGLYGLLKPLDLMQPYRLEMGTKFANSRGENLYDFWGSDITEALNSALAAQGDDLLINLASNEYFKAVKPKLLNGNIITPQFKELRGDIYKIISFSAKKARGLMSRFIIENRIRDAEQLKSFDLDGYSFNPELSKGNEWVFSR